VPNNNPEGRQQTDRIADLSNPNLCVENNQQLVDRHIPVATNPDF
jgi:hypothetical protein